MSEIRATTISDAAGTGPITLTGQSAAKAYLHASAGAVIQESFNISSTVDGSVVGRIDVSLTNAMNSSVYVANGTALTANDAPVGILISNASQYITYSWDGATRTEYSMMSILAGDLA